MFFFFTYNEGMLTALQSFIKFLVWENIDKSWLIISNSVACILFISLQKKVSVYEWEQHLHMKNCCLLLTMILCMTISLY